MKEMDDISSFFRSAVEALTSMKLRVPGQGTSSETYVFSQPNIPGLVVANPSLFSRISAKFTQQNIETTIRIVVPVASLALSLWLGVKLMEKMNPNQANHRELRKQVYELLRKLGVSPLPNLTDYEVSIATSLIDPQYLKTSWTTIGGLTEIINEIQTSVIIPFTLSKCMNNQLPLFRAPKGVLFHGPPGCGKTMLACAMAKAANARFLNLQVNNLVNMWYGETQKLADAVFSLARKLQPSIIFIDEIDSFLTKRSSFDNEATRMMKTQFMAMWDGLLTSNDNIMVVGATNRPGDLDAAILRRLPYKIYVPMPDENQRLHVLSLCLNGTAKDESLDENGLREIAQMTENLSGSDITEVCREATSERFRLLVNSRSASQETTSNGDLFNSQHVKLRREDFNKAIRSFKERHSHLVIPFTGLQARPQPEPLD